MAERSPGHSARFVEDEEAVFFHGYEELVAKVKRYLPDEEIAKATIRAVVSDPKPEELTGEIEQAGFVVILSPSGLIAQDWPLPPKESDEIVIDGRHHRVMSRPFLKKLGDVTVRIELRVEG